MRTLGMFSRTIDAVARLGTPRGRLAAALALVTLAFPVACGTSGVVGGECMTGRTACGDAGCVDTLRDEAHCGSCDNVCGDEEVCFFGECTDMTGIGTNAGAPNAGNGGGGVSAGGSGGGDLLGGAGGSGGGTGGDGGTGGVDGCPPIFNTADHCGACNARCDTTNPVCAEDGSGSFQCVPNCVDPFSLCGTSCVNLDNDPFNCGSCGRFCSTGLCSSGRCVGATSGHLLVACTNFRQVFGFRSELEKAFGNALFLPGKSTVRVVSYVEHAPAAVLGNVDRVIAREGMNRNQTADVTQVSVAADVIPLLDVATTDVLFVPEQSSAPAGTLASVGASWQTALSDYLVAGGVVIVLNGGQGTDEMGAFAQAAGLVPFSTGADESFQQLINNAPGDVIGANVTSPFIGFQDTCALTTTQAADTRNVFVVTTDAGGGTAGDPVVIHRIVVP